MTGGYQHRPPDWQDSAERGAAIAPGAERRLPGLHDEERLPWLDAGEDELYGGGIDPARVWAVVLVGLALLVTSVGGVWWTIHRGDRAAQLADGSIIAAPPGPIKVAPQDPGGKTFDGTGDSSFTVSQGHSPGATLAGGGDHAGDGGAPADPASAAAGNTGAGSAEAMIDAPGKTAGGVGVQVGAFSTQLAAEAAWEHLAKAYDALSGSSHRIVEGKADIGTVYRLQVGAGNDSAATALCERLKTAGLNCQVKD